MKTILIAAFASFLLSLPIVAQPITADTILTEPPPDGTRLTSRQHCAVKNMYLTRLWALVQSKEVTLDAYMNYFRHQDLLMEQKYGKPYFVKQRSYFPSHEAMLQGQILDELQKHNHHHGR